MRELHVGEFVVYREENDSHIKKGCRGTVVSIGARKTLVVDFENIGLWETLVEEVVLLEKLDALMPCCGVAIPEESNKYGTAFEVYSYSVCGDSNAAYFEGIDVSGEEFSINMDYWSVVTYDVPLPVRTPKEEQKETTVFDPVNNPPHYQLLPGVEVIDVLDALCNKLDKSESLVLTGAQKSYYAQMMGYLMRCMDKNGLQDMKKARFYLARIIKQQEGEGNE